MNTRKAWRRAKLLLDVLTVVVNGIALILFILHLL